MSANKLVNQRLLVNKFNNIQVMNSIQKGSHASDMGLDMDYAPAVVPTYQSNTVAMDG